MTRQTVLKEPLVTKTITVYPSDWDKVALKLKENGGNMSHLIRTYIEKEAKKI